MNIGGINLTVYTVPTEIKCNCESQELGTFERTSWGGAHGADRLKMDDALNAEGVEHEFFTYSIFCEACDSMESVRGVRILSGDDTGEYTYCQDRHDV